MVPAVTIVMTHSTSQDGLQMSGPDLVGVYLGLKVTRVFRVARLFVTISFFVQGPSLAFDHSRCVFDSFATVERRRVREGRGSKESPPPPPRSPQRGLLFALRPTRTVIDRTVRLCAGEVCNQLLHFYSCAL